MYHERWGHSAPLLLVALPFPNNNCLFEVHLFDAASLTVWRREAFGRLSVWGSDSVSLRPIDSEPEEWVELVILIDVEINVFGRCRKVAGIVPESGYEVGREPRGRYRWIWNVARVAWKFREVIAVKFIVHLFTGIDCIFARVSEPMRIICWLSLITPAYRITSRWRNTQNIIVDVKICIYFCIVQCKYVVLRCVPHAGSSLLKVLSPCITWQCDVRIFCWMRQENYLSYISKFFQQFLMHASLPSGLSMNRNRSIALYGMRCSTTL